MSRKIPFPQLFVSISTKYVQLKARKAMEILNHVKAKVKLALLYLIVVGIIFLFKT